MHATSLKQRSRWLRDAVAHATRQGVNAQWAASLICAVTSLGLSVLLARLMSPAAFGNYAFYLGVGAAMGIALDGGLRTLLLRERAAPTPALALPPQAMVAAMLGHLLVVTPLLLGAWAWRHDGTAATAALCFAAITLTLWYSAWLKGSGALHREARWQLLCRFSSAAAILLGLWLFGPRADVVFLGWTLGLAVAGLIAWPRRQWRATLPTRTLYRSSLSFAGVDLATLIYHRADIVLLYALQDDLAEVGRYAAAYRLYDGILLLTAPLALILFRRMRQSAGGATGRRLEALAMGVAMAAGAVLAAGAGLLGTPLAGLLFGAAFTQAHLIGWLFCALIAALPNAVLTYWAIAHHQERFYALSAAAAALVNLALNAWLIPHYGALGAAWSTMAAEGVLGGLLFGCWWGGGGGD